MKSKYWFAYSVVKEKWLITDLGRWSYPLNWKGSLLTLLVIIAPIALLLASIEFVKNWPDWALGLLVLVVAGGSTVIGVLIMRVMTDPKLSIEDYRAAKARIKGDTPEA